MLIIRTQTHYQCSDPPVVSGVAPVSLPAPVSTPGPVPPVPGPVSRPVPLTGPRPVTVPGQQQLAPLSESLSVSPVSVAAASSSAAVPPLVRPVVPGRPTCQSDHWTAPPLTWRTAHSAPSRRTSSRPARRWRPQRRSWITNVGQNI